MGASAKLRLDAATSPMALSKGLDLGVVATSEQEADQGRLRLRARSGKVCLVRGRQVLGRYVGSGQVCQGRLGWVGFKRGLG